MKTQWCVFDIAEFLEPYSCTGFVLGLEWMRNVIFSKVQKVFLEISTYLLYCWACVEAVVCLKVVVLLSERLQLYELFLCAQHYCFSSLVLQNDFKWVQPSTKFPPSLQTFIYFFLVVGNPAIFFYNSQPSHFWDLLFCFMNKSCIFLCCFFEWVI